MSQFNPAAYTFLPLVHRNKKVILVKFSYNKTLANDLKAVARVQWSHTHKAWYSPDNKTHRALFGLEVENPAKAIPTGIHPVNRPAFKRFTETLQLKAYSPGTIRTYSAEFAQLLKVLKSFPVNELTPERLRSYFLYCIQTIKLSENLIHSRLNAVKFYFDQVLGRPRFMFEIPRPKKPSLLPRALSVQDVRKMLLVTENKKHYLLLAFCYGMGLRVSELVNLRISDIDSKRMQVLVRAGKGKKDRYVHLPKSVLENMRDYYKINKPKEFLFEGRQGGPYAIRSVQLVFKAAMKKARINKEVGIHSLRHSYATHLLEAGTDISFIQTLLGHKDIKTTLLYTKVATNNAALIQSPLDRL